MARLIPRHPEVDSTISRNNALALDGLVDTVQRDTIFHAASRVCRLEFQKEMPVKAGAQLRQGNQRRFMDSVQNGRKSHGCIRAISNYIGRSSDTVEG